MPIKSSQDNQKLTGYVALSLVSFFWGTTYMAIRVGVAYFPAFLFSGIRNVTAGVLVLSYFYIFTKQTFRWSELKPYLLPGIFTILISNGLVTYAEKSVPSGVTAILCSIVPFIVAIYTIFSRKEELVGWKVFFGLAVGFAGLLLIFYDNLRQLFNPAYALGILCILGANFSWSLGSIWFKNKSKGISPLLAAGFQMAVAGLGQVFVSAGLETWPMEWSQIPMESYYALGYLIIFGSIVGYGSYTVALAYLPATVATLYAYINPVIAVGCGAIFLHEKVDLLTILGTVCILVGVFGVNQASSKKT